MDTVYYVDGYKVFFSDGILYVNDVKDKRFKTPADIVLATGMVYTSYKRHIYHYHKHEKEYIGDRIIDKKVTKGVLDIIKNIIC